MSLLPGSLSLVLLHAYDPRGGAHLEILRGLTDCMRALSSYYGLLGARHSTLDEEGSSPSSRHRHTSRAKELLHRLQIVDPLRRNMYLEMASEI